MPRTESVSFALKLYKVSRNYFVSCSIATQASTTLKAMNRLKNLMKCSRFSNLHPPETLREFGEVTTLHGIRYITKPGSHFFDRLCWTLVIVGSAIMCAREVTKTYSRWRDSPVITSFAQQPTDVSSIPFPAVTICPESKVLRSVIDVEDKFDWLCDQLDNNTYNNPEDQLLAEAVSYVCVPETGQKLPSSMKPTLAHRRKIFEIAPQLEDVLEQCQFFNFNYNCSDLFHTILTSNGVCFTFNMLSFNELLTEKYISPDNEDELSYKQSTWDPDHGYLPSDGDVEYPRRVLKYLGPSSGLEVTLKTRVGDSQQICSASNKDNFRVQLHSPVEFSSSLGNYFHVSRNSLVMVTVRPDVMETDASLRPPKYSPHIRGCVFPEERTHYALKAVTKYNSLLDGYLEVMVKHCNCSLLYMPLKGLDDIPLDFCTRYLDECKLDEMKALFDDVESIALPSCNEMRYKHQVSNSKYEHANKPRDNTTKELFMYSKMIIFYEDATFLAMRKSELYGITDFIANCGGLLGLFTGFSVISLMEICYFASLRLVCRLHQRGQQSSDETVTNDEVDKRGP